MSKLIAIIPARGGSKGISDKNKSLLGGKPLISHTIEPAINCELLTEIIVTSDDKKILEISSEVSDKLILIDRPNHLSTDDASLIDVTDHAIQTYIKAGNESPDTIILLQPTSPFRTSDDIVSATEQFNNSPLNSLLSVSAPIQHPSDFIYKENSSWRACFKNDHTQEGRQNFIETWFINGAIYIVDFEHFKKYKKFYSLDSCEIFHMSIENSIDIDSPIDLLMAEGWINEKN